MKRTTLFLIVGITFLAGGLFSQSVPKAKMPVLTTSAGHSPDVESLNIVMEEAGLGYDYCVVPTPEMLGPGVGLGG